MNLLLAMSYLISGNLSNMSMKLVLRITSPVPLWQWTGLNSQGFPELTCGHVLKSGGMSRVGVPSGLLCALVP